MISAGIVLVDALLHEPHPKNARVEIEIFLCRSGNRGDVMKALNGFHCDRTIARSLS
jgi:hypothetical protein